MELNFKKYSDEGPPLLILHGLFGSLANWNWQAKRWAGDFAVYALDLRNHGGSPHAGHMDYPGMADDLLQFLDAQGIGRCYLLGHSMGGKVAMQFALEHPERVAALLVADITPAAYEGEHDDIFRGLLAIDTDTLRSRRDADEQLAPHVEDEQVRQFLLSNLARDGSGRFFWRVNLPVLKSCYDHLKAGLAEGKQYEGPVLFLRGGDSDYIHEEHRETIQSRFPAARVKTLMNAGHWLHAEKPESFNRLVKEFLQELEAKTVP